MPARHTYICDKGHEFEHFRINESETPKICIEEGCEASIEILWRAEKGDYFGTMGLIDRL